MAKASTTTLKLLIDTRNQKVLFAEANKDFVDFLFSILCFPVGALNSLPILKTSGNDRGMVVTCLDNLYTSINNLSPDYMLPNYKSKINMFKPVPICVKTLENFFLQFMGSSSSTPKTFYKCAAKSCSDSSYLNEVSNPSGTCPKCKSNMRKSAYVFLLSEDKGYVRELVTYMVMDDLVVKPLSSISFVSSINTLWDIKNIAALEVKEINFGKDEAMKLLKAALESKTVLTDVFLRNGTKR